jgi:transcription factor IIIB subunit 2
VRCGHVFEEVAFSADITFQKDAAGESTVVGQFVNESGIARGIARVHGGRVYAYQADSHERAQQRGRQEIAHLVDMLRVVPREETVEASHRLYKLALQRGFTRGRRTNQVAAACLYLICRQENKPFLLIDFSDALQVNLVLTWAGPSHGHVVSRSYALTPTSCALLLTPTPWHPPF